MENLTIKVIKGLEFAQDDKVKRVFLCRHGSTEATRNKRYSENNQRINKAGVNEAKEIRKAMHSVAITNIYSSPFARAKETAAIVSMGNKYSVLPELRERDYGIWVGKNKHEIYNCGKIRYFLCHIMPYFYGPKNGEALEDFYGRIENLIYQIKNNIENDSLLITHGSVIQAIMLFPHKKFFFDFWTFMKKNRVNCGEIYTLFIYNVNGR